MNELLNILQNWTNLQIVGGSLIIGFILKTQFKKLDDKHIPLLMSVTGIGIGVGLQGYVSFEVSILGAALSGLASTGLHQVFHQYIKGKDNDIEPYFNVFKQKEDK